MPPLDGNLGFKFYAPINNISINIFVGKKKKKMQILFAALLFFSPQASHRVRISQGGGLGTCNFTEHS